MSKTVKKVKFKDAWELHHDLVEVHWVNDVAVALRFHGCTFVLPNFYKKHLKKK